MLIPFTVKRQILTHQAVSGLPLWLFTARSEQQFNLLFNSQFLIGKLSTVTLWSKRVNHQAGSAQHKAGPAESCKPQTRSQQRRGGHTQTWWGDFCTTAATQLGAASCVGLAEAGGSCELVRITHQQASESYSFPTTEPCTLWGFHVKIPASVWPPFAHPEHNPCWWVIISGHLQALSFTRLYLPCGADPPLFSSIPLFCFSFFPRT